MALKVYGIKNCDSVKKALKVLDAKKASYDFIDFKKNEPSEKDIKRWLKNFGAELVINKRGTTWRGLSDSDKQKAEGKVTDQVALIQSNPMMIKRPIIESGSDGSIGFNEDNIKKLIK